MKRLVDDIPSYFESFIRELSTEFYLIQKGVRSCALLVFPHYDREEDIVNEYLKCDMDVSVKWEFSEFETEEGGNFCELFLYKYSHQLDMKHAIDIIKSCADNPKHEYIAEWMLGKLLGYSDENMEEFLKTVKKFPSI